MKLTINKYVIAFSLLFSLGACAEFLDEKPDISLVVPTSLDDLQGLLDDSVLRRMNTGSGAIVISADDIILSDVGFAARTLMERQVYTWDKDLLQGTPNFPDWSISYQQIFNANLVLNGLENFEINSAEEGLKKQRIKGRALFYRAMAYHNLMELFCLPYNPSTAPQNLGLPLRKSNNINLQVTRSNLEETFQFILKDLNESVELLPDAIDVVTRPSKVSAFALLTRLSMIEGDFEMASEYARTAISLGNELKDYNTVNAAPIIPFPFTSNQELIFHQSASFYGTIGFSPETMVNPVILEMYEEGDLRRNIFFRQTPSGISFKGNYSGQITWFTGLAMDEVYLNLAESLARTGRGQEALDYMNILLEKRFNPNFFNQIENTDEEEILQFVLNERRKTLLFRPVRWMDLRRFNQSAASAIVLSRQVGGEVFTLSPNSLNFALPIPENDIELGGLIQNKRE
ncbi:RagB/SusD family nutrient uptake outer membrane protein [Belliella aquatica]|uniref:SusD family protein n=1 Tax=Belliella aquatica TaxID=1323734 RepID=A0ABQ1M0R9_9BACT|nr:RagB/SusD family nutrient uptake outer membrane protein [Belliella aquatica]MCH7407292.1 RagB/SusD family nutrient uptake outer membrane protein [Belliella aquatica]GGC31505.1 hypothetical protein GCM10010993_08080 [Belliella aquatica]